MMVLSAAFGRCNELTNDTLMEVQGETREEDRAKEQKRATRNRASGRTSQPPMTNTRMVMCS